MTDTTMRHKKKIVGFLRQYDNGVLYEYSDNLKLLATETGEGNVLSLSALEFGICSAIDNSTFVSVLGRYWSERSGQYRYPVPHPEGACTGFSNSDNLWIGEYGEARKRLCLWLAETIDNYLTKGLEDV